MILNCLFVLFGIVSVQFNVVFLSSSVYVLDPSVAYFLPVFMNLRKVGRIDYKVYHKTGEKINLKVSQPKMDATSLAHQELKFFEDIKHSLKLYAIEELFTEEECQEAFVIDELYKNYRHVHVDLKNLLSDEEYKTKYPKYKENSDMLMDYLKSVKKNIRDKKSSELQTKSDSEKNVLSVELEFLQKKVDRYNDAINVSIVRDLDSVDKYVAKMEGFIDEFFSLSTRIKCICPDEFEGYAVNLDESIFEIQQDIILATRLKHEVIEFKEDLHRFENLQNARLKHITNAENLKTEIAFRFQSLSKKFGVNLDSLGDYQILEMNQNQKTLDLEFNSALEKVTELASLVSLGGEKVVKMLETGTKTRGKLACKREQCYE